MINYTPPEPVDWPSIINDLCRVMSERQIAKRVLGHPSNINHLKKGKNQDVKFQLGARLIALHAAVKEAHG